MVLWGVSAAWTPARAQEAAADASAPDVQDAKGSYPFFVHVGPGDLLFKAGATVRAAGAVIPGGTVKVDPNLTLITELGYRWRSFSISLTGGYPPRATVAGAGSLAPLGTLGRIRYGPALLTVQYHFAPWGRVRPYVGAGPAFLLIFGDQDGAVRRLKVQDSTGAVLQGGAEYVISRRWSLALSAKTALLGTKATALLGDAPINAHIRLDPRVIGGGLTFHF
jgi:outer membrane protein